MESVDLRKERECSRRKEYKKCILRAAETVILKKGFRTATMDDVAREAQISKATLYQYFKSKAELIEEIILEIYREMIVIYEKILSRKITFMAKLREIILTTLKFYDEKENIILIIVSDRSYLTVIRKLVNDTRSVKLSRESRFTKDWREKYETLIGLFDGMLKEGVLRGECRDVDTRSAVIYFFSLLDGLQHFRYIEAVKRDVHKEADMVFDLLTRGLAAPGRPIKGEA